MKRKDTLLLPVTLAFALAAAPVLAQSTGAQGGATGNTGATGTDSRPSTAQGTTGATTPGTAATTPGATGTMGSAGTGTAGTTTMGSTGSAMGDLAADSVLRHRPRLSQLIGTNVYNDRNETIGEVDDIILAAPAGMAPGTTGSTTMGSTTGGTTSGATSPGGSTTAAPGTAMSAGSMQAPMAVIQVGGFLGMGGRLVMVPISELQWNAERERVIMPNATKESLQGRPAFTYDSLRRG